MKEVIFILVMLFIMPIVVRAERVDGYWRDSDGDGIKDKYVNPYNRSDRNDKTWDNYSTKPNINPYTGKEGTKDPFKQDDKFKNNNPLDTGKSQRKQKNWFDND